MRTEKAAGKQVSREVPSLPNYTVYTLSTVQKSMCILFSGVLFAMIGYLFYHQWILSLLCAAGAVVMPRYFRKFLLQRRRSALSIQFKQALYSLSSSLSAGRSVENGFREAVEDLRLLSPDGDHDLIFEFNIITACLEIGQPVEAALQDLARRARWRILRILRTYLRLANEPEVIWWKSYDGLQVSLGRSWKFSRRSV